jgi:L-fuconolactonase
MEIIDSQMHEIGPRLAWGAIADETKYMVLAEINLAFIDAVGVDVALLDGIDDGFVRRIVAEHPERFRRVVHQFDPEAPDVEDYVARCQDEGVLGLRVVFGRTRQDPDGSEGSGRVQAGRLNGTFRACERLGMPLFCFAQGQLPLLREIAERYPELAITLDHLGVPQPPGDACDDPVFKALPGALALADCANVTVKLCGLPALSDEPYPFRDVWPRLEELVAAFGADRLMWAGDIPRFEGRISWDNWLADRAQSYLGKHAYAESLGLIRDSPHLSEGEKALILGGTARRVLRWPAA